MCVCGAVLTCQMNLLVLHKSLGDGVCVCVDVVLSSQMSLLAISQSLKVMVLSCSGRLICL